MSVEREEALRNEVGSIMMFRLVLLKAAVTKSVFDFCTILATTRALSKSSMIVDEFLEIHF